MKLYICFFFWKLFLKTSVKLLRGTRIIYLESFILKVELMLEIKNWKNESLILNIYFLFFQLSRFNLILDCHEMPCTLLCCRFLWFRNWINSARYNRESCWIGWQRKQNYYVAWAVNWRAEVIKSRARI